MSSMSTPTPKILIIGAGISGLAFAHGLQKHNIPFQIYERDTSQSFRAQGYRVRLAGEGLVALRYLLDDETWSNFELTCAEMRLRSIRGIDALTGTVSDDVFAGRPRPPSHSAPGQETPKTVDRTVLREVLLKGLKEGSVLYGKGFERYAQDEDGVAAFFQDGTFATGTLLVGADGGKSHVRRQRLPNLEIVDTGGRCIYGKTHLTEDVLGKVCGDVMGGMAAVKDLSEDDMLSMVIEPVTFPRREEMEKAGFAVPQDYLYWVLVSNPARMGFGDGEVPHLSPGEAEQLALRVTASWDPSLKAIFEHQAKLETAVLMISSIRSDFGGAWEPDPQVTLIGDAVGLMGPTAGSGAITALRDAHNLCRLLVEEGQSKETIGRYEEEMREYTGKTVEISYQAGKNIFGMKSADAKPMEQVMAEVRDKRGQQDLETSQQRAVKVVGQ